MVNTVSEMASWITLSCIILNGPPFPENPIRFAGTWAQYSKNASPHENRITRIKGHPVEIFISWSFRWPYHANVMNMFDVISSSTVSNAFISLMI